MPTVAEEPLRAGAYNMLPAGDTGAGAAGLRLPAPPAGSAIVIRRAHALQQRVDAAEGLPAAARATSTPHPHLVSDQRSHS